jgi:hypothetical protein
MKNHLLAGLLAVGVAGCGSPGPGSVPVSARENTWLEVDRHWTGAFSGSQHDEFRVSYVRRGWWQDERIVLHNEIEQPEIRRLDASTLEVTLFRRGEQSRVRYVFPAAWPAVQAL